VDGPLNGVQNLVGFMDVFLVIVMEWLGHPAASPMAAAGVRPQ
jgi:hypothetical protein